MHRQRLGLKVLHQAEDRADEANPNAHIHQRGAADAAQPVKFHPGQIGNINIRLPGQGTGGKAKHGGQGRQTRHHFIYIHLSIKY